MKVVTDIRDTQPREAYITIQCPVRNILGDILTDKLLDCYWKFKGDTATILVPGILVAEVRAKINEHSQSA